MELLSFKDYSEQFDLVNEWNSFKPESTTNHVVVYGVEEGKITEDGTGSMMFQNIEEAQETFKDLDPFKSTKKFTPAYALKGMNGVMMFSTWKKIKVEMKNNGSKV